MTSSQSPRDPASGLAAVPGREPGGAAGTGPTSAPGAPTPIRAMPASRAGASCTGPAGAAREPPSTAEPWASPLEDHETCGSGAAGGFTAPILAMIRRRRRCASRSHSALQRERSWRRPIFPRSYPLSIFGAGELNCRVRDGNGCGLSAWVTRISRVMGDDRRPGIRDPPPWAPAGARASLLRYLSSQAQPRRTQGGSHRSRSRHWVGC